MNAHANVSITVSGHLDPSEYFTVPYDRKSKVQVEYVHGRMQQDGQLRLGGRGHGIKADGTVGAAPRTVYVLHDDDVPDEIRAALMKRGRLELDRVHASVLTFTT